MKKLLTLALGAAAIAGAAYWAAKYLSGMEKPSGVVPDPEPVAEPEKPETDAPAPDEAPADGPGPEA